MNRQIHPSKQLSSQLVTMLRSFTANAEAAGQLMPGQLNLVHENNWFNLFVPERLGGLNLPLPQAVQLEESLAWVDGSLGWVVTLCSGAAMFVGFFNPKLADEVFDVKPVCLAGSGQQDGTAEQAAEGYIINGSWPYASGAVHASHFTANCKITLNGEPILNADGSPVVKSFVFTRNEVRLEASWNYIGLNASAGHSFSVTNIAVPEHRAFIIEPKHAVLNSPIYHYPFLQMAEVTLAANSSGMCIYFMDLCEAIFHQQAANPRSEKTKQLGLQLLSEARVATEQLRDNFYEALHHSWEKHAESLTNEEADLLAVSIASRQLVSGMRTWVDRVYPYCGLEAARTPSAINQVWRNIHTASQHNLLLEDAEQTSA